MPKSNLVIEPWRWEVGVIFFFSPSEKKGGGAQDMLASPETLKGGEWWLWRCWWGGSTLSHCLQLHPFRELGGDRGVCVCVYV